MFRNLRVMVVILFTGAMLTAQYEMKDSVISNGGGTSSGGSYDISGSVGQNFAAGASSVGATYAHTAGFWNSELAPTAAGVSIGGRVRSATGVPLPRVRVMLAGPDGLARSTLSNTFGFYRFEDVEVGTTYLLQAVDKQFQFAPHVVTVAEEITELDIVASANP